jgi:hypothetical protein
MTKPRDVSDLIPAFASPQSEHYIHFVSIEELCREKDRFDINPDYQRETICKLSWQQQLINTILAGEGIGLLEGYKHYLKGKAYWEIMDGHQRIKTIEDFVNNLFKTMTPSTKMYMQPISLRGPIEGGLYFDQLSPTTKAYFMDYHLALSKATEASIEERVTRFMCLNAGHALSPAEKKHVYPSKANFVARRLVAHPFWSNFYIGHTDRKRIFLSSLYLLALQVDPERMVDLRRSIYIDQIAAGRYDDRMTDELIDIVEKKLEDMSILYAGMQFSDRATAITMYQSIHLLHEHGYTIAQKHKGILASWLANTIEGSKSPGATNYNQPVQKMLQAKGQQEFWEKHLNTILALVRVAEFD